MRTPPLSRGVGRSMPASGSSHKHRSSIGEPPKAKVLIASEHPATALGIRATLDEAGFEVCAEVSTAPATLDAARKHQPDKCLIEIELRGEDLELAVWLTRVAQDSHIILLTSSHDEDRFMDAIEAGISGYLFKDISPEKLCAALRGALAGEGAFPRQLTRRVIEELRHRAKTRKFVVARHGVFLTRRESDVVRLLRRNLTTQEIGRRLSISPVTVRTHLSSVVRKCQAEDREAIIEMLGGLEQAG